MVAKVYEHINYVPVIKRVFIVIFGALKISVGQVIIAHVMADDKLALIAVLFLRN